MARLCASHTTLPAGTLSMNTAPARPFWHGLRPSRTRHTTTGLRLEKWHYTVRNHRGNIVATGERWLVSNIPADFAAKYLPGWWVDESERRPLAGWNMTCRPAWRVRKAMADIPAGWVVRSGYDHPTQPTTTRRPVPDPLPGLLRGSRPHRDVRTLR